MHNQYSFRKFFNYERNYKTLPFGTEVFTEHPEMGLPIQAESIHRWSGICKKNVELVKSDLQHEVVDYTKDDQSYIIYRKIWKSKPQMTHYEKDYYEAKYIENCEIKKITRCNKLFEFEEIYSHKRLLEICSSNEFMMATWKLIDEKYIGDFDCHLYVITDATEIPIGLLYYHLFNDKFHISGFEVASTMRRLGIGTVIIKQFFNEYKVSLNITVRRVLPQLSVFTLGIIRKLIV